MSMTKKFVGEVAANLRIDTAVGLMQAVRRIVPEETRRRVLGYRLVAARPVADELKREVVIEVDYSAL